MNSTCKSIPIVTFLAQEIHIYIKHEHDHIQKYCMKIQTQQGIGCILVHFRFNITVEDGYWIWSINGHSRMDDTRLCAGAYTYIHINMRLKDPRTLKHIT